MSDRMVDRHGTTVEQVALDGRLMLRLRLAPGRVFPDGRAVLDVPSVGALAAAGLDMESLRDAA